MNPIGVGLYGLNGHQIQKRLVNHPPARLVAVAAFNDAAIPGELHADASIARHRDLDALLADPRVELVSLCSPRRRDQADDAIRCLRAGKHVYAEKPCAMSEEDLDAIVAASRDTGRQFHEMAGTVFAQPYVAFRRAIREGLIGTVVQALVQKSYPFHDRRPGDEDIDGGQIGQNGVHALRFVEHLTGLKIETIEAFETRLGGPSSAGPAMAASMAMRLDNGAVACVICNYLNQKTFGKWGNESVRIFGTDGFIESVDGGTRTRMVTKDRDHGPLALDEPSQDYLDLFLDSLQGGPPMPLSLEDEIHPTRMTIRAKLSAIRNGRMS